MASSAIHYAFSAELALSSARWFPRWLGHGNSRLAPTGARSCGQSWARHQHHLISNDAHSLGSAYFLDWPFRQSFLLHGEAFETACFSSLVEATETRAWAVTRRCAV